MIIYNVTVKVDPSIEEDWLEWMRSTHIPDVMQTGCFVGNDIMQLRYPKDEQGATFAIQYTCEDMAQLEKYHREFASALQQDHVKRYGDRAVAFRTILEKLDKTDL